MYDLLVIGHLLKERIIFADGREVGPVLGSPAAYSSTAAARSGLKTGLVSLTGRDMPAELLEVLRQAGVDMQGTAGEDRGTENLLIYDGSGRKRLEFTSRARQMSMEDIPGTYRQAGYILICPIDREIPMAMLKELYDSGCELAVDLGGCGGASSAEDRRTAGEKLADLREMSGLFGIVKAGLEDWQKITGRETAAAEEYLSLMEEMGVPLGIITLGDKGAALAWEGRRYGIPVYTDKAVDCTGAGDSWFGAFMAEYIKSGDALKAGRYASAFASIMVEKSGGINLERIPARAEAERRLIEIEGSTLYT